MRRFALPRIGPSAVVALTMAALAVFVGWPLARLLATLLGDPSSLMALLDGRNGVAAANTLLLSGGVLALATGIGAPLGFLLGRTDLPARNFWRAVCTAPYIVPPYVTAIAWITLANPTNGVLTQAVARFGVTLDIYTLGGMVWVMGLESAPFVMLATADALGRMDASLEEQARIAGATPLQTLVRVTFPLAVPALVSSASFVLANAAASFGVPYLLASGTADPDFVLTTRIYQALDLAPASGRPIAVALSIALLAIGVGFPALISLLRGRRRYTLVTGKATRVAPFALGRAGPIAAAAVAAFALVAVVAPLGTIVVTSLLENFGRGLSLENLTLANYVAVLGRPDTGAALMRSLALAGGAATVAVVTGALVGWTRVRTTTPGRGVVSWFARLPYSVPGTVLALGLILAWSQEVRVIVLERVTFALALADTIWLLGLAYVAKFLAFPVGNAETGLEAIEPSLEEAARMSGASFGTTLTQITTPLLRPNLIAAWFLVFMPAFTEVTMSILLSGPDTRVVGTVLFDLQTYGDAPAAAVLAVVVTAIVLGGNAMLRVATRGRAGL